VVAGGDCSTSSSMVAAFCVGGETAVNVCQEGERFNYQKQSASHCDPGPRTGCEHNSINLENVM